MRMTPAVFDFIEECIHRRLEKEAKNPRQLLEVDIKLVLTLRQLATRESPWPITEWLNHHMYICH